MIDLPFFSKGTAEDGRDGVSPTVTIEDIEGGHRLKIIDAHGTKTVDILDGAAGSAGVQGPAGKDGQNGKDGVSAAITGVTASVDNTSGTPKVSVTAGGTSTARTFDFSFTGLKGATGENGLTPFINENGIWQIGETDTGIKAEGVAGKDGADGKNGVDGKNGIDGISITKTEINANGELVIDFSNSTNTNLGKVVGANGTNGTNGKDGINGTDGITPHIGNNGNWFLGDTDTGIAAQGPQGEPGPAYKLTEDDKSSIIADVIVAVLAQLNLESGT